jgi:hypothetical protein
MDTLVDMLRDKIEKFNETHRSQIEWELKQDKLKEIIKKGDIPDKFIKKGRHQSKQYLSRDDLKRVGTMLNDLLGEAETLGIFISTSPSRRFSRSPSHSPTRRITNRRATNNVTRTTRNNITNARAVALNRVRARTANALHRRGH